MSNQQPVLRCGLLTRVSSLQQASRPEGSLKSQKQQLRAYLDLKRAAGEQVKEVRVYSVEDGVSGAATERPDLEAAMDDIRAGRINCLVVTEVSRLSRSVMQFLQFVDFLNQHGCALISIRQQFDTTTPHGKFTVTLLIALAELERAMTSQRTREGRLARAERGLYNGGKPPLGYDPDPDRKGYLVINEDEAAAVRLAFDLYEQLGCDRLVMDELNVRGYRTKKRVARRSGKTSGGGRFKQTTVAHMLRNPTYVGLCEINSKMRGADQDELPESRRYRVVQGQWEPIVPIEQFDRVQELRRRNYKSKRSVSTKTEQPHLLKSLVVCDECGTLLEPGSGTGADGRRRYYYRHSRRAPKDCPLPWRSLPASEVEKLVLGRLGYLATNIELIEEIVALSTAALQGEIPEVLGRLRERQRRLAALKQEADGLLTLATAMPEDQRRTFLEPKLAAIKTQMEEVEAEIALLERSKDELQGNAVDAVDLQHALQTFDALFAELEPHEQQELLGYLVDEIRIDRSFMTIKLFGKPDPEQMAVQRNGANRGVRFAPISAKLPGLDSNLA